METLVIMKTFEEAANYILSSDKQTKSELDAKYKRLLTEIVKNQITQKLINDVMINAIVSEKPEMYLKALFIMGITIGMEMEKQDELPQQSLESKQVY